MTTRETSNKKPANESADRVVADDDGDYNRDVGPDHRDDDHRVRRVDRDDRVREDRTELHEREREQFGGMRFGAAFFGWLCAAGLAVLLGALVAAIVAATGLSADDVSTGATTDGAVSLTTLGVIGAIAAALVVFIAYFAGGYVAGRMARFSGAVQGLAVWLWAIIAAVVAAGLTLLLGARFDILGTLDAFPRIPMNTNELTVPGIVTAVVLAVIPLIAAVLGGMTGMRYHRRVDRTAVGRTARVDDTVIVEDR